MLEAIANQICDEGRGWGLDLTVYSNYVGRGITQPTYAVVGSQKEIIQAIALAAADLAQLDQENSQLNGDVCCDNVGEFVKEVGLFRWDQMGKSDVVVY